MIGLALALLLAGQSGPTGELITRFEMSSDYPQAARRNGWQGDVQAELTFNSKGRVTACKVVKSSTYPVLDKATCDLLTQRARFKTKDTRGAAGTVLTPPIEWRLTQ
jgi:periplasmic protein TonB